MSAYDNCPGVANPDQANSDGNACDAGDTARPTVTITSPSAGAQFAAGSDIAITTP